MGMPAYPKRPIKVDQFVKQISLHARREKSIRHGHIPMLHVWWVRRPPASSDPQPERAPE
jgi:adenine-specific DNA methylase